MKYAGKLERTKDRFCPFGVLGYNPETRKHDKTSCAMLSSLAQLNGRAIPCPHYPKTEDVIECGRKNMATSINAFDKSALKSYKEICQDFPEFVDGIDVWLRDYYQSRGIKF